MIPKILLSTSRDDPKYYVDMIRQCGGEPIAAYCPQYREEYDSLLLAGGVDVHPSLYGEPVNGSVNMDTDRDEAEITLIRAFLHAGKPIFGICRGLQLLNVYFGGTLYQDLPTAPTHSPAVYGQYLAHGAVAAEASPCRALYGAAFPINSHHHQGIHTPGNGLTVTMWGDDGTAEEIVHTTLPIWAVQWHPEKMCLRFAREDTVDGLPILQKFVDSLK
jgi:putative glutamine amidotransferase